MDLLDDIIGAIFVFLFAEIIGRFFHCIFWGTGVLAGSLISLGRFQVEPFRDEGEWVPEDGRPILGNTGATVAGVAVWIIILAAIFRDRIF